MLTASDPSLQHAWYRSAADHSRQTLFPRGLVMGLAGILLLLLWAIVPTQQLQRQLGQTKTSDALTIAYMQAWIAADPDDHDMEFLLARHMHIAGRHDEAMTLAEKVIKHSLGKPAKLELLQNAQLLKLSLIESSAFSFKEGTPERQKLLQSARNWLAIMALQTDDKNMLRIYLRRSMALDDTKMSLQLATRINPRRGLRWGADTGAPGPGDAGDGEGTGSPEAILSTPEARGKDAVANGRWQEAADIYWVMFDEATKAADKREILLLLIRNEQWGNRLPQFFRSLEPRLAQLPQDHEVIKKLAKLAMAANRLDLAEKFVRQMMRFSSAPALWETWFLAVLGVSDARAEAAPKAASREELLKRDWDTSQVGRKPEAPPLPKAGFEEETFTIAYQVFLAKGYQEDAYKVAASAVRQVPTHGEWRRRLAQISEWTQRQGESLGHWLHLAQNPKEAAATKPLLTSEAAWANVKRLGIMLNDLPAQVLALEHEQERNPRDTAIDLALLDLEEQLGDTDKAIKRLQKRIDFLGTPASADLLRPLLDLAIRLQDVGLIMATTRTLDRQYGPSLERAAKVAAIIAERGRFREALDYMMRFETIAADPRHLNRELDKRIRYWSQLAELARGLQNEEVAVNAYSHGLELGSLERHELDHLAAMLENSSLVHAARVMMQGYLMDQDHRTLTRAALLWIRAERPDELAIAIEKATPAHVTAMLTDRNFLKTRASYFQSKGRFAESLNDFKTALRIDPADTEMRVGLVWLLMAAKQAPLLEQLLRQWHHLALREHEYWGVFGAAYLSLGEPQKALPFFAKQAKQNNDYLWRLSYADALESAGMADPAWLLRKKAWTELQKLPAHEIRESADIRERVVALAMQFAPADSARQLLASLVRERDVRDLSARRPARASSIEPAGAQMASIISTTALAESMRQMINEVRSDGQPATRKQDAEALSEKGQQRSAASEMALSYLLSREGYESARAWLLTRYANALSQPAWARLSVALATQDRAQVARLLDEMPDWLPRLDKIEALKMVGRGATAQTVAFETLDSRPGSQAAYNAFIATLGEDASVATLSTLSGRFSDIDYRDTSFNAKWRLNQRFTLSGQFATGRFDWDPAPGSLAAAMPLATQTAGLGLKAITERGYAALGVERNSQMRTYTSLNANWHARFERGWTAHARAASNASTAETPALRIAGMKDIVEARISHQLTGRDSVSVMLGASRYSSQNRTVLGTGFAFVAEYSHQLDKLMPALSLNVQASRSQFNHRAAGDALTAQLLPAGVSQASDFFLPQSFNQFDVFLSMSDGLQNHGRGPLKPFGQFGIRYNSLTGAGYNLRAGLVGTLLGRDSFMMYLQSASATPGSTRGSSELGLKYNYFF